MNILVLNGSPKGENSITLQTVNYLRLLHPEHRFETLHIGARIRSYEKDLTPVVQAMNKADLVLFSYPVYTFIAPWQLHRLIELLKDGGYSFPGLYATQITTSKHFYDVTAHRYIQDNCTDLGMRFIRGLSADMDDLTTKKGQKEASDFFAYVEHAMAHGITEPCYHSPCATPPAHRPVTPLPAPEKDKPGDVVILTNMEEGDAQLAAMIDRFRATVKYQTRVVNIARYPFKGGCLGCFHCAATGKCIYTDGFDTFLRTDIQRAQAIIMAFSIKDHSMGASFKLYDDRQFCNGHRTVTMGMPMGYLISGDYSKEFNLQMILDARAQVGGNFLAGIACDETDPDRSIDALARSLEFALEHAYVPPQNFYGIGGMKIFRDLIWIMQGLMRADHKFYKAHGQYDFPQKQRGRMMAMYLIGSLMRSKKLQKKAGSKMTQGMLMPYSKALKQVEEEMAKRAASDKA